MYKELIKVLFYIIFLEIGENSNKNSTNTKKQQGRDKYKVKKIVSRIGINIEQVQKSLNIAIVRAVIVIAGEVDKIKFVQ